MPSLKERAEPRAPRPPGSLQPASRSPRPFKVERGPPLNGAGGVLFLTQQHGAVGARLAAGTGASRPAASLRVEGAAPGLVQLSGPVKPLRLPRPLAWLWLLGEPNMGLGG